MSAGESGRERAHSLLSEVVGDLERRIEEQLKQYFQGLLEELDKERKARLASLIAKLNEITEEAESYKRQQAAQLELELKQVSLGKLEGYMEEVLEEAKRRLGELRRQPKKYRLVLAKLLEEALGLSGIREGYVEVAAEDSKLMEDLLHEFNARGYALKMAKDHIITAGGLRLVSLDGKLAVNNTVEARLQRAKADIRAEIYRLVRHGDS
ncbi:MAG: hypothetical protein C4339_00605 [Nitrososphaerota archaeon]